MASLYSLNMLDDLINLHHRLMSSIDVTEKRYLYDQIHWDSKALCIHGARGVGKTTLICQFLLEKYTTVEKALYISGDNIHVHSLGLLEVASRYFDYGGEALFIDEVHKYPNWSIEVKNIIDSYRNKQIIISGSSSMDLINSKADLSRRVVYYELLGLSFREYLKFLGIQTTDAIPLSEILSNHLSIAEQLNKAPLLKHFNNYLVSGYYPYFMEGVEPYLLKLNNVIEKIINEDIAATNNIKQSTLLILKKLLWLVATSKCLIPNIEKISKNLQISRDSIYTGLNCLEQSGLITNIYPHARGMKLIRKPSKIYMGNTNLIAAINGSLSLSQEKGPIRETFFASQVFSKHSLHTHDKADFLVDGEITIEVGGKSKTQAQIKTQSQGYLAIDDTVIGLGKRVPLYLFGFLY